MEVREREKRGQPADFRTPLALKTKQFGERKSVAVPHFRPSTLLPRADSGQGVPFKVYERTTKAGIKSMLSVPIRNYGMSPEVIGALVAQSHDLERSFREVQERRLYQIADSAAVALQAAQRYQKLEKRSAHLKALAATSRLTTKPGKPGRRLKERLKLALDMIGDETRMIENMLAMIRKEGKRDQVTVVKTEIANLLDKAARTFEHIAQSKRLALNVDASEVEGLELDIDPVKIQPELCTDSA